MSRPQHTVLICIWIVTCFSMPHTAAGDTFPDFNSSNAGKVLKQIKDSDNLFLEKEGRYCLKHTDCSLCWEVAVDKETKKTTLSSKQPLGVSCPFPFAQQLVLHRKLLTEIFNDWKKDQFTTVSTGPLARLEPAHTWSTRIALASAVSADWRDWRENYPKHASKKSSNQIFIDAAKQADACRELADLFKEFGLKLEITSVEKVFAKKAKDLPFYRELKSAGVEGNPTLMYDAGMINFSVSAVD